MALRFAEEGANIVITGKTSDPHPTLSGTIHTVAEEVAQAGGHALALQLDVSDARAIDHAVEQAATHFGGIDILINNASAISLRGTLPTSLKRFDRMMSVNARATFACSRACIPFLKASSNPHIVNISPPLNMQAKWFKDHLAYTYSKYGMSLCTLGMSEEFKADGIAVNSLWPVTTIATAAIEVHFPPEIFQASRKPEIMADAVYAIVTQDSRTTSGKFFTDEQVLQQVGITDFSQYSVTPGATLQRDFFLD